MRRAGLGGGPARRRSTKRREDAMLDYNTDTRLQAVRDRADRLASDMRHSRPLGPDGVGNPSWATRLQPASAVFADAGTRPSTRRERSYDRAPVRGRRAVGFLDWARRRVAAAVACVNADVAHQVSAWIVGGSNFVVPGRCCAGRTTRAIAIPRTLLLSTPMAIVPSPPPARFPCAGAEPVQVLPFGPRCHSPCPCVHTMSASLPWTMRKRIVA